MLTKILTALGLSFTLLLGATAQSQKPAIPEVDMRGEMINKFVRAIVEIEQLSHGLQQEVAQTQGKAIEAKIKEVNERFKVESVQIIFESGLSMDEYIQYTKRFKTDPKFKKMIMQMTGKE